MTQAQINDAIAQCQQDLQQATELRTQRLDALTSAETLAEPYNQAVSAAAQALADAQMAAQSYNIAVDTCQQQLSEAESSVAHFQAQLVALQNEIPEDMPPPPPVVPNAPEGLELIGEVVARWRPVITEGVEATSYVVQSVNPSGDVQNVEHTLTRDVLAEGVFYRADAMTNYNRNTDQLRVAALPYPVNGRTSAQGAFSLLGAQPSGV